MNKKPSEFNTKLDEHLIDKVAHILYNARIKCLNGYEPENGDTPWSNGVRSREWCRKAIRDAANDYDFLEILKDKGQSFVFAINGVPVKFYKDDATNPSSKLFKFQEIEQKQYELFSFDGIECPDDIMWRFVVETDITLDITKISLIGLGRKSKKTECLYDAEIKKDNVRIITPLSTSNGYDDEELEEIAISYKTNNTKEQVNG